MYPVTHSTRVYHAIRYFNLREKKERGGAWSNSLNRAERGSTSIEFTDYQRGLDSLEQLSERSIRSIR